MKNSKRIVVALVMGLVLSACAGGGTTATGCATYADNPHKSGSSVNAKSRTYCSNVKSTKITMNLEKLSGSNWYTVKSTTTTIWWPVDEAKNVRQVNKSCVSGTYRHKVTVVNIYALSGVSVPITDPVDYSQAATVNC